MSLGALVVIDGRVPQADAIVAALTVPARVVRIDPQRDGLGQLLAAAQAAPGRRLIVVCHGGPGRLTLGDRPVTAATLRARQRTLAAIGACLGNAPIELYACEAGRGAAGEAFLATLAAGTGRDVAAATGFVGGTAAGGSWLLDAGARPARPAAFNPGRLAGYAHRLPNHDVANSGQLQAALNSVVAGDSITLTADTVYNLVGSFLIPSITIIATTGLPSIVGGPIIGSSDGAVTLTLDFGVDVATSVTLTNGSGTLSLVKTGTGVVSLGPSGYTGTTTIQGGELRVTSQNVLPNASDISLADGTLRLDAGVTDIAGAISGAGGIILSTSTLTTTVGTTSTHSGQIQGSGGTLGKAGAGTLTLSGTSTGQDWQLRIDAGTVSIGGDDNIGTGTVTFNGAAATLAVTGAGTVDNAMTLTTAGTVQTDAAVALSGIIGGGGAGLTKTGTGTLALSGANTYSGTTTVSAGTLSIGGDGNLGTGELTLNGGTLAVTGAGTIDNTIALGASDGTVEAGAAVTLSGIISGGNDLTKTGAGTLTLSGANTYSGTTTVSAGTLSVAGDGNLGTGAITLNGGTLAVTGATTVDNTVTLGAGNGTVEAGATVTVSGAIGGAGGLTKTGAGTLTLSGTSSYSGGTTVSAGTLRLGASNALADGGAVSVSSGATLDLNDFSETIGPLSGAGNVSLGSATLTVVQSADGTLSGGIGGTGGLSKTGAGTLTLSGTSSYSGTTTVSAGTLSVAGALTGSAVGVASGGTLGGTGSITGAVSVASGGFLAPGASPGTLATGNLTLAAGSTLSVEIDGTTAGTQYDQIAVTGSVDVTGATLTATFGYSSAAGHSFVLIANDGVDAVTGTFTGLAEGATFASGGRTYRISYAGNDGNDVTLTDYVAPSGGGGGGDGGGGAPPVTSGSADADRLTGSPGADTLDGGAGADTLSGGSGSDSVLGGSGADLLYGNQGSDTLRGQEDPDTLVGGQDGDLLYGNQGDDVAYGNLGSDILYGGQGNDRAFGGQGADVMYGNLGGDALFGNLGDDVLYGGQGDDTLSGGAGNDLLVGGLGADRYAFATGDGADTIGGFSAAQGDVIAVAADANGSGIASAGDLLARLAADAQGNALLDLGQGNSVTLIGLAPQGATADWFLVV